MHISHHVAEMIKSRNARPVLIIACLPLLFSLIIHMLQFIRDESRCYNKESKDSVSSPAVTLPGFHIYLEHKGTVFCVCRQ